MKFTVLAVFLVCAAAAGNNGTRILIMVSGLVIHSQLGHVSHAPANQGDSWGTVSPATEHFEKELKEHDCPLGGFTNIAIGGTTAKQWSARAKVAEVKAQVRSLWALVHRQP
jgi:hypothetical protein